MNVSFVYNYGFISRKKKISMIIYMQVSKCIRNGNIEKRKISSFRIRKTSWFHSCQRFGQFLRLSAMYLLITVYKAFLYNNKYQEVFDLLSSAPEEKTHKWPSEYWCMEQGESTHLMPGGSWWESSCCQLFHYFSGVTHLLLMYFLPHTSWPCI